MRRLFCEQARAFFKNHLKVDIEAKNHYLKLNEALNTKNILKSKVINLLPQEDLALVASHPCFLRFKDDFVGFQHLQDKISSFKKLRFYLDIPEESTCSKCSMASVCPLKNKVPDAKVTSSKDALWLVYYMAASARYAENKKAGQASTDTAQNDESVEKLLAEEATKQNEQISEELQGLDEKHSRPPVKLPPDTPISPDQEFALYLSGIRLLDQMGVLVCNTVQEREKLDEMLETQILEYTTKKKLDQAFRIETGIKHTLTKKRDKREETRGMHDLVAENKRSMEAFSKPFTTSSDNRTPLASEPASAPPRDHFAPKPQQRMSKSKNPRKNT